MDGLDILAIPSSGIWFALGLTFLAGLATGIGSAIAFLAKRTDFRLLSVGLAFSAGVMLYISFTDILSKATASLAVAYGPAAGAWLANAGLFGGILVMALIDWLVPMAENPHEVRAEVDMEALRQQGDGSDSRDHRLWRMGIVAALAITIHNFPEGIATFLSALHDPKTGIAVGIAVALHNIPEGVSVSVPIFYATGNRRRAFALSVLSGLAEPLGALLALATLNFFVPEKVMGLVFGAVAGVMIYVSLDELLPTARRYGKSHEVLAGIVAGMVIIAISLLLLG